MHRIRQSLVPVLLTLAVLAVGIAIGWSIAPGHRGASHDGARHDRGRSSAETQRGYGIARESGYAEGRKQGRTEMQFLQQYHVLRSKAHADAARHRPTR
jgi:hypothetical protein